MAWLWSILAVGGWSVIDVAIFACFAIAAPWSVLGVWNAAVGLALLRLTRDPVQVVAPFVSTPASEAPIRFDTAILMTLRNEDPARAFARLRAIKESLDATGEGARFSWFVLSDTDDLAVAAREVAGFAQWRDSVGEDAVRLTYRRREANAGYKAGNLRDFCTRWGEAFEFMLPLDADSLMDGATIQRMVRLAQAWPKLGILQSLVVGAPSSSAFARVFQFGMRHGMRPYTMGAAWWAGDCGPFWGHNALVRIAPFAGACELPLLGRGSALGGAILSHDQVEAVLMRRAGFEVRVLPEECGSFEDNPPTLLEYTRRDLRWCQGNLQYIRLLGMRGIEPMSRFQLIWAIMMFIGIPAWTAIVALAALKPFDGEPPEAFPAGRAIGLYVVFLIMYLAPKLAGFLDIAATPGGLRRYGGAARFIAGCLMEVVFSLLQGASTTLRTSLFMIGLLFGRTATWNGQTRDAHALPFRVAWRGLWPQTVFGVVVLGLAAWSSPRLALWSLPLTAGYVLAVPFAMLSASAGAGRWLQQARLCATPEEFERPPIFDLLEAATRDVNSTLSTEAMAQA